MTSATTSTGTTSKYCSCTDPVTGKKLGAKCPLLKRADGRWSSRHGLWRYQYELPPHKDGTRRDPLRRAGFLTETDATDEIDKVSRCLALAGDKPHLRVRVADLIMVVVKKTRTMPDPEALRPKLHASSTTTIRLFGELLDESLRRGHHLRHFVSHV